MHTSKRKQGSEILLVGTLGGIAGGVTEIAWISAYGAATGAPVLPVARGIVESTIPQVAASAWAPALGIVIHLGLAVALGIILAIALRKVAYAWVDRHSLFGVAILALVAVWSMNFLIVLPRSNPDFVYLLPYSVTLFSKVLFALSAAATFRVGGLCR